MSKEHFYDIIKSPVISEKGTLVSEQNQVVFNVAREATKQALKDWFSRDERKSHGGPA